MIRANAFGLTRRFWSSMAQLDDLSATGYHVLHCAVGDGPLDLAVPATNCHEPSPPLLHDLDHVVGRDATEYLERNAELVVPEFAQETTRRSRAGKGC
jgi:hypothetical protein